MGALGAYDICMYQARDGVVIRLQFGVRYCQHIVYIWGSRVRTLDSRAPRTSCGGGAAGMHQNIVEKVRAASWFSLSPCVVVVTEFCSALQYNSRMSNSINSRRWQWEIVSILPRFTYVLCSVRRCRQSISRYVGAMWADVLQMSRTRCGHVNLQTTQFGWCFWLILNNMCSPIVCARMRMLVGPLGIVPLYNLNCVGYY